MSNFHKNFLKCILRVGIHEWKSMSSSEKSIAYKLFLAEKAGKLVQDIDTDNKTDIIGNDTNMDTGNQNQGGSEQPIEPEPEVVPVPVANVADLKAALAEGASNINITEDIALGANEVLTVPADKEVEVVIDEGKTINVVKSGFVVEDGGHLILKGNGTIKTSNKSTAGTMVSADGPNALIEIDGITLDAYSVNGKEGNYAYGIYLLNNASCNFKSGIINCAYGSCISTNNTTGGNTAINISGGELHSDGSYAIYMAAQGTLNVTGGIVQGINARMGTINISNNAQIIPTTITEQTYDNIGAEFNTSGCVWVGDTIAVMGGTYNDAEGTDCHITIADNATVSANFRAAVGIYSIDTKQAQNITVDVANANNLTSQEGFDKVKVYGHEYIAEQAAAKGKTYNPVANSNIQISM